MSSSTSGSIPPYRSAMRPNSDMKLLPMTPAKSYVPMVR
eukprot:CAMPEP_0201619982 /NCGR_PEP_ID=MMETSP0492-20130828/42940_1 /ASSEMBLY_ACC=CAM_ASM_000837 /TAXON_ID=420259 /ORGANISM="Thalassiosira gravida, Strain GMp14c1" /LENGTH=38 /DNA_ID= /DNA_START= /DNA_END= /DNA_ORIENTATION=